MVRQLIRNQQVNRLNPDWYLVGRIHRLLEPATLKNPSTSAHDFGRVPTKCPRFRRVGRSLRNQHLLEWRLTSGMPAVDKVCDPGFHGFERLSARSTQFLRLRSPERLVVYVN
jgi:hypothetical protein